MDKNDYVNVGAANSGDVRVSYKDYLMLIDTIHDVRFSREALWKFKMLWLVNFNGIMITPIIGLVGSLVVNRFIIGPVKKGAALSKVRYPLMSLTFPIICYWLYSKPLPRRLYTELLAGDNDDGTAIREEISTRMPGYWLRLSSQLHKLGYDYPEMHEYSKRVEFGKGEKSM